MIASISLDLDNQWSYQKTHGDEGWQDFPSYLPVLVPRVLELLSTVDLKITFFVVGQDADRQENQAVLKQIADAGHEIGNHSYHHEPWLHLYTHEQLIEEFERSESAIQACTGQRVLGFRGPGFSYSPAVLDLLSQRGYRYDASTFPTFLGPVARAYYLMHSGLSKSDRKQRKQLFGSFSNGFKKLRPYRWKWIDPDLIEIPVTTLPWFKVPIHLSYIMYLATFSRTLARIYFASAMNFCWLNRVEPSLLLHPLDFMGNDDSTGLDFFPGMSVPRGGTLELAESLLRQTKRWFECMRMIDHCHAFQNRMDVA